MSTRRRTLQSRSAALKDLETLLELERLSFSSDRLTRRQFREMLTRTHARTLVAEDHERRVGEVLVLFNRVTSAAKDRKSNRP